MEDVSEISEERHLNQKTINRTPVPNKTISQLQSHPLKVNILNLYLYLHDNIENLVISTHLFLTIKERSVNWKILDSNFCNSIVNEGVKIFIKPEFRDRVNSNITTKFIPTCVNCEQSVKLHNCINEFLSLEVIKEVERNFPVYNSHVFVVHTEERSTKDRMIFNMKPLNKFLEVETFTMISIHDIIPYLSNYSWATAIDISKAYLHLPIDPEYEKYFSFSFAGKKYIFRAMPFGLASAPYIFTRFTKPIWSYLRKEFHIMIFAYLDDILILAHSFLQSKFHTMVTIYFLNQLGFKLNLKKSCLTPSQTFTYLGTNVNLANKTIGVTDFNKGKILNRVSSLLREKEISKRQLERVVGTLNFNSYFTHIGRSKFVELITVFNSYFVFRKDRDSKRTVPLELQEALKFWLKEDALLPRTLLRPDKQATLWIDASKTGWGGVVSCHDILQTAQGLWNEIDSELNSNNKELLAILRSVKSFHVDLLNKQIVVYSDNRVAISTISKSGSKNPFRHKVFLQIQEQVTRLQATLTAHHIQGRKNLLADSLSRKQHLLPPELTLSETLFQKIIQHFKLLPEVDLFANEYNAKLPRFVSSVPTESAMALDAFSLSWSIFKCVWAFPPPSMIHRILFKWKKEGGGKMMLVAPDWPSQSWYSILMEMARKRYVIPPESQEIYLQTKKGKITKSNISLRLTVFLI